MLRAVRRPQAFLALAPLALGLVGCAGNHKQTGDEGSNEYRPMDMVESDPPASPSSEGEAPEPMVPPSSPGGPLDSCRSTTWTAPDEPKREAGCTQYWDESGDEPVLRYVCSCDIEVCPFYGPPEDDGDPLTTPEVKLNDCVVDGVDTGCADSLEAACGLPVGEHGFCEHPYHGHVETRTDQDPPDPTTVACFEGAEGTFACTCPNEPDLVTTAETECHLALLRACQAPCESPAGRCEPSAGGYDCSCSAGFEFEVETGLCDYALFWACEPNCSNEEGACYLDPSGGPEIVCRCNDGEPERMDRDPDVTGDECRTPLVDTCGGSAEGPNAWPQ